MFGDLVWKGIIPSRLHVVTMATLEFAIFQMIVTKDLTRQLWTYWILLDSLDVLIVGLEQNVSRNMGMMIV